MSIVKQIQEHIERLEAEANQLREEIERLNIVVQQHRGALGYPVPGDIMDDPNIMNGLADAREREIELLRADNRKLMAIVTAVHEFDHVLNPTYSALIDWLESVSPYEDVIAQIGGTQ